MPSSSVYFSRENYDYIVNKMFDNREKRKRGISEVVNEIIAYARSNDMQMEVLMGPTAFKELKDYMYFKNIENQRLGFGPVSATQVIETAVIQYLKKQSKI